MSSDRRDEGGPIGGVVARAVASGVIATLTMDAAMVGAGAIRPAALNSRRLSIEVIGRWAGDLLRGRWRHDDISREAARPGDAALGMLTHYATGIGLTVAFLAVPRRHPPTMREATAYGLATSVLPLLVMFPSLGYGCFGRRSGEASRLNRIMLLGHTAFGLGIGIGAKWMGVRRVSGPAPRMTRA